MELRLAVTRSRVSMRVLGDSSGREAWKVEGLVKMVELLLCPFSGDDCLELESSMADSRPRAPDLGG